MVKKIGQYFKSLKIEPWKISAVISVVLFLALILIIVLVASATKEARKEKGSLTATIKEITATSSEICTDCIRRKIDGVYVPKLEADLVPLAVMIDNHPAARPQAGLEKANLVYEAEVEGGYTRLMAIFSNKEEINNIGPIRSARPYFLDWAEELKAVYIHCGGSPEALTKIEKDDVVDLNQFYNDSSFWRSSEKLAPHNIFTSHDNLLKFLATKNNINSNYTSWLFKDDKKSEGIVIKNPEIKINFNQPETKVSWVYNKDGNDYWRYLGDTAQITYDNNKIAAKNIIVQYVPAKVIDSALRLKMDDVGSGQALVCLDGSCQPATWKKNSATGRTIFSYANNIDGEVIFNAGTTWVEVVRPEIKVVY